MRKLTAIESPYQCPHRWFGDEYGKYICGLSKKECKCESAFPKDCPLKDDDKIGHSDYRMRYNIQRIADSLERIEKMLVDRSDE